MLRAVGVLLLAGSGLALGLGAVDRLSRSRRNLSDLAAALSMLEGELVLSQPSTPVLLETLAHRAPGRAGDFFRLCADGMDSLGDREFQQIWACGLADSGLSLPAEEERLLLGLGAALGRYDSGQLLQSCRQCRERLERAADRTGVQLRSQGRVYGTLGLSLGIFAAILLL